MPKNKHVTMAYVETVCGALSPTKTYQALRLMETLLPAGFAKHGDTLKVTVERARRASQETK